MGASTSAYQIEGAYNEDGKGLSVQDIYETPEGITDFKVASDHYHKMKEDVRLMAELGMKAYRFSIAWTRIIPDGDGEVNEAGVRFYNELIDELIAHDIIPVVTMYHFDLPLELHKRADGETEKQSMRLSGMQGCCLRIMGTGSNTG